MTDSPDALGPLDRDALEKCIVASLGDPETSADVQRRLDAGEPWLEVAMACCYHVQRDRLALRPWEAAPCMVREHDPRDADGRALAERLIGAGLSQFEPDPLTALQAALKPPAPKRKPAKRRAR